MIGIGGAPGRRTPGHVVFDACRCWPSQPLARPGRSVLVVDCPEPRSSPGSGSARVDARRGQRGDRAAGLAGGTPALRRRGDHNDELTLEQLEHEVETQVRMVVRRALTACRAVEQSAPDHQEPVAPKARLGPLRVPLQRASARCCGLEHLFDRLGQLMIRDTPVDHHFALATIFEIMDVASRADLKSGPAEGPRAAQGSVRLATVATRRSPRPPSTT